MLDILSAGLPLVMTFDTLMMVVVGVLFGLFVGALPGLGPLMGMVLVLPFVIGIAPIPAIGLLTAIFVAGSCGGSISAILLGIPGTPLAAATLLDGYPMAKAGRGSDAIGIAIAASAVGGLFGGAILIVFTPLLAEFASGFTAPEYTALAITGLVSVAIVSEGSLAKALIAGCFGLFLATIGTDQFSTGYRFTFDSYHLLNGFHIVAVVVGLFAIPEMVWRIMQLNKDTDATPQKVAVSLRGIGLTFVHWINLLRSSAIGAFFGAVPGASGVASSFVAYAIAKGFGKPGEVYGSGFEGGVVATESANNATVGGAFIPTLALGIPGDASAAVLIGALLILGVFPGPGLFEHQPEIVGGVFLVYLLANVLLLFLGVLVTPIFAYVLQIKTEILVPIVLLLCAIGTYALQASVFDLWVMLGFGAVGIVFRAASYPLAPVVIGSILGPLLENNYRRSLLISHDGHMIFLERPISAILLIVDVLLVLFVVFYQLKSKTKK